jgi:hypothetical protein
MEQSLSLEADSPSGGQRILHLSLNMSFFLLFFLSSSFFYILH